MPTHELLRDGVQVLVGTETDCWDHIHDHHCYSVSHALQYEGYEIRAVRTFPEAA